MQGYVNFLKELEACYAGFTEPQRKHALNWLKKHVPPDDLGELCAELFRTFSQRWKTPPWISEFDEAYRRLQARRHFNEWKDNMLEDNRGSRAVRNDD